MVNKFITSLLSMSTNSDLEAYCIGLQREGLSGSPTAEEAKREYRKLILSRDVLNAF